MKKDLTILIMVMIGIISFIVGYSMSPSEIKTCPHECCHKAGIKAKKQEKEPIVHKEKVEHREVIPTLEKQPAKVKKDVEEPIPAKPVREAPKALEKKPAKTEEEVGGYGEEIGYGY